MTGSCRLFLAVQMVSPVVLLVPIYGLVARLGLLDTHAGLVLVYAAIQIPFTVIVLEELLRCPAHVPVRSRAPRRLLAFRDLPPGGPAPAGARPRLRRRSSTWPPTGRSSAWPWCLLDSQARFTIPIGLFSFQSGYETEWHLVAAASFIGLLPVLLAFVLLQRFFVAGLTAGAVKG